MNRLIKLFPKQVVRLKAEAKKQGIKNWNSLVWIAVNEFLSYRHNGKAKQTKVSKNIIQEYKDGASVLELCNKYHLAPATMRRQLVLLGVKIRRRGYQIGNRNRATKLLPKQIQWVLDQDNQDVAHATIARKVNVTRERIRQICLASNHKTRHERQTKILEYKEQRAARKLERKKTIMMLSKKWNAGASFGEIAILLGQPAFKIGPAAGRISELRKQYPNLFPYRRPPK